MATAEKRGNSYKIVSSEGYSVGGKQVRHRMTWTPDPGMSAKAEAKALERQKVLFDEKCRSGQYLDGNIKFADFVEKWLKNYADKNLRPRTLARYKEMLPRINAALGHIPMEKLRPNHLLSFYDNLGEAGSRADTKYHCIGDFSALLDKYHLSKTDLSDLAHVSVNTLNSIIRGNNASQKTAEQISTALKCPISENFEAVDKDATLSAKTILHHHRLLSSILSTAVEWQVIFSNPCDRTRPPKVERDRPKYLDEDQARQLLELLNNEDPQYRMAILALIYTGLRRGELLGLEWSDIDFDHAVISVRRSSLYLPDRGVFVDETKNETSMRAIKISLSLIAELRQYRAWQAEYRLSIGDQWQTTDRLFTTWDGRPMHPDTLSGWFHEFIDRSDLPSISIHSLRHTNATLQIAGGVPITTVAGRLGHATPATTTKIYAHAIQSANEAAAQTLENLLTPSENRRQKNA